MRGDVVRRTAVCAAVASAIALGAGAVAGSLTPPGAPAPTMKTLNEVEARIPVGPLTTPGDASALYVINQSGSYYLTGNITGASGMNGVTILASNVTLDLNGFTVQGVFGARSGVTSPFFQTGVVVCNGTVSGWPRTGVEIGMDGGVVRDLQVSFCGVWGINVSGSYSTLIERVSVIACGGEPGIGGGIAASEGVIRDSTVRSCGGEGILGGSSLVTGCSVVAITAEAGASGAGISASMVESCRVVSTAGVGIWGTTLVRGCTVDFSIGAKYAGPNVVESY